MASHQLQRNAAATIAIRVVVTLIVSVMGQSDERSCSNGCQSPRMANSVSFVITKNVSRVDNSVDCFPYNTELLYVCKDQFLTPENLFIKCTRRGWLNRKNLRLEALRNRPRCGKSETREPLSFTAVTSSSNIVVEIDGQNINIDDSHEKSLYYSVGTNAIYKCKNPKPNPTDGTQSWRCLEKNGTNYSWEKIGPNTKDLVCEDSDLKEEIRPGIPRSGFGEILKLPHLSGSDSYLLRNLLIGICSFLGFVMICCCCLLIASIQDKAKECYTP